MEVSLVRIGRRRRAPSPVAPLGFVTDINLCHPGIVRHAEYVPHPVCVRFVVRTGGPGIGFRSFFFLSHGERIPLPQFQRVATGVPHASVLRVGGLMPKGLKRYYGRGDLHFLTFSCYRRLPLLGTA